MEEDPPDTQADLSFVDPGAPPPASIGGYRLLDVLGHGGMGVVWRAEQPDPQRAVALKVMRAAAPGDDRAARAFRREIEALGRLQHPGIASIYEAGTDGGVSFFAMELVDGVPLHEWALGAGGLRGPDLPARLRVMARICEAVACAHHAGVIHRDLKPSNVLVVGRGPDPAVKVLDFGLARILDDEAWSRTEAGTISGTLPYMSPEHVRGAGVPVDARSDVYSLGVLLYEMVAGRRPYEVHWNRLPDAVRVICEEPPAPLRAREGGGVDRDLRTIVEKALEKDPRRRYASAAALGDDLERHLAGHTVLARPASAADRFRKLVARHRLAFAALATAFAVLVAFSAAMAVQSRRLARERDRAEQARAQAQRVSAYLVGMLQAADPETEGTSALTVREMLDRGAERALAELGNDPALRAEVLVTVAWIHHSLGDPGRARPLAEEGVRSLEAAGAPGPERAQRLVQLADILRTTGDAAGAEARLHAAEALAAELPADAPLRASIDNNRGLVAWEAGRPEEAARLLARSLEVRRRVLGPAHPDVANSLNNLALAVESGGRLAAAESLLREALALRVAHLGPRHPRTLNTEHLLGRNLRDQGRLAEARGHLARALAGREAVLGPRHPDLGLTLSVLGGLALQEGDLHGAEKAYERALAIAQPLESAQVRVPRLLVRLGLVSEARGSLAAAEARHRDAVARQRRLTVGPVDRVRALLALARVTIRTGRLAEAATLLAEAEAVGAGRADVAALLHAVRALHRQAEGDRAAAARERAAADAAAARLDRDLRDDLSISLAGPVTFSPSRT